MENLGENGPISITKTGAMQVKARHAKAFSDVCGLSGGSQEYFGAGR